MGMLSGLTKSTEMAVSDCIVRLNPAFCNPSHPKADPLMCGCHASGITLNYFSTDRLFLPADSYKVSRCLLVCRRAAVGKVPLGLRCQINRTFPTSLSTLRGHVEPQAFTGPKSSCSNICHTSDDCNDRNKKQQSTSSTSLSTSSSSSSSSSFS